MIAPLGCGLSPWHNTYVLLEHTGEGSRLVTKVYLLVLFVIKGSTPGQLWISCSRKVVLQKFLFYLTTKMKYFKTAALNYFIMHNFL